MRRLTDGENDIMCELEADARSLVESVFPAEDDMPDPIKVYVAGPYTRPDPCINTNAAIMAGDRLWAAGLVPFVPHLTHLWHTVSPHPYQDWLDYDMHWLRACDVVLRLPGESSGADKEVAEAERLGIPVFTDEEALLGRFLNR